MRLEEVDKNSFQWLKAKIMCMFGGCTNGRELCMCEAFEIQLGLVQWDSRSAP